MALVADKWNIWNTDGMTMIGGKWSTQRKTCSSATLLNTNSIQTGLGLNLASMVRSTILKIILHIKFIKKWNNALLKVPPPKLQIVYQFSVLNYVLYFSVSKTHSLQLLRQLCQLFKARVGIYPCNVNVRLMIKFYTKSQNSII